MVVSKWLLYGEKMTLINLLKNGFIETTDALTAEEVFEQYNSKLLTENYVTEGFLNAIEKREEIYPTGIVTKKMNIAVPHIDAKYSKCNALIIIRAKNKLVFKRMDDPTDNLEIKLVFLLIIKNSKLQVNALSELTKIWQNDELMKFIYKSKDIGEVIKQMEKEGFENE